MNDESWLNDLRGLLVLDFSTPIAGPHCARMPRRLGAVGDQG